MKIDWTYFDYTEDDSEHDITYADKRFTDVNDWKKNMRYLEQFSYARICDEDMEVKEDFETESLSEVADLFNHLEDGDYVEVGWEF